MRIKVTVDSTCDLSPELLARCDISVAPLSVNLGGGMRKDLVDITPEDIYRHVDAGGDLPKTSAVNVTEYRALFEACLREYDAVIHVNISSEMSACYQNAVIASDGLPVYPVDSRSLSTGSALLALSACDMAKDGRDAREIVARLNEMAPRVDASFLVSRLDYLRKGGRCSAIAALGANILKLRPCIEVRAGKMGVGRKYRGPFVRCLEQYIRDRLEGAADIDTTRVFITHSGVPDETAEAVRKVVAEVQPFAEIHITHAGCTVSSHCGEGTLGVLYVHTK